MRRTLAVRRSVAVFLILLAAVVGVTQHPDLYRTQAPQVQHSDQPSYTANAVLHELPVKGRAPKSDYSRNQFGDGWERTSNCDTRNEILRRDLVETIINAECQVVSGILNDPYTGKVLSFQRGGTTSQAVQIDHVVALSDAWQKGAQQLSYVERVQLANDPLELLAVEGGANQQKSDSDAASWLPSNRAFRCQYVARQIAVKKKYKLWVTQAEKDAMVRVLNTCPGQQLPQA